MRGVLCFEALLPPVAEGFSVEMTARISAAAASTTCFLHRNLPVVRLHGGSGKGCVFFLRRPDRSSGLRKLTVCFLMEKTNGTAEHKLIYEKESRKGAGGEELRKNEEGEEDSELPETNRKQMERSARRKMERYTYLLAAALSSVGITSMAAASVYYRFAWQMEVLISVFLFQEIPSLELS